MPRASRPQVSFTQGEWSPLTYGRVDVDQHAKAMQLCRDFVPCLQGTLTRRPGTAYVAGVKGNATAVRFQPFIFNTAQAYVLEFTDLAVRFYTNGGQLLSGGTPYTVTTPYAAADLWGLNFTQSADVMYIVHPSYPPKLLKRLGATNWTLTDMVFTDGPYLTQNVSETYLTASVTRAGSTGTLTANVITGLNGGAGFQASDVGRLFRVTNTKWVDPATGGTADPANTSKWIWVKVTSITSTTVANITVQGIVPVAA